MLNKYLTAIAVVSAAIFCCGCSPSFVAPNYPLLPLHTATEAHRLVLGLYADLVSRVPGRRIVVAGDSAGGGFALALALEARDAGLPLPARVAPDGYLFRDL